MFAQRKAEPTSLDTADTLHLHIKPHAKEHTDTWGPGGATQTETARARPAIMTSHCPRVTQGRDCFPLDCC